MSKNKHYQEKAHAYIPGGAHTYSRGDDQFPSNAPPVLERGKDAYVWDADGNRYLDYGMGLRSVTLGYDCERVSQAAIAEVRKGNGLTRPSVTEIIAAEIMVNLIPPAEMVKFAKNGSTVTTAAVKLARAYTGRKYVARCAEHPFFSYDDWFIGSTVIKAGVPEEISGLTLQFHYNDPGSLERLFAAHPDEIAAVIMEPVTVTPPERDFLQHVRRLCTQYGAVFILDEMITGFRFHLQGAQTYFGVEPDLSTFGKGMANGFSVAALVGKRRIMEIGGIANTGTERVFLVSTTHGAEMCGLGAFTETVKAYHEWDVVGHIWKYGQSLKDGLAEIANELGIREHVGLEGYVCSPDLVTRDRDKQPSVPFRTLFVQEMLKNGVLMPWLAVSYAHQGPELDMTLQAARKALQVYVQALESGIDRYLVGPAVKPVFRKFN
jgi:glutamate-1-semialdehyde 2,1-aminomutase